MRCLTLAHKLKSNKTDVKFICRRHEGNLIQKIRLSGFKVLELAVFKVFENEKQLSHSHWLGATQNQDANDCISILRVEKPNWLVVDHYGLDEKWQIRVKPFCKKLMVIDDLADRRHQCDILLDQTFGRKKDDYSGLTPKECNLLLGSKYALLRPEFSEWRKFSLKRRAKPEFKKLLINMGGIDINNFTEQILDKLLLCNLPKDLHINILIGSSAPYLESVKSKAGHLPYQVQFLIDAENIAEIMANSDISIGASGSTTWERCCLGLPSIQFITAKNQKFIARNLKKNGIIKLSTYGSLPTLIKTRYNWMKNISVNSSKICDGTGADNVIANIE